MSSAELLTLPDGRRVQWWDGGDPAGRPVFFLHGCPDTRHAAYPGDVPARELGIRLLAVNRPGYGASSPAAATHLSVADDTAAVADLLGLDRFAVLGMSVGGPYALATAARHPDRVSAAAVVSAPGMTVAMDPPWPRDGLDADGQAFFGRLAASSIEEAVALMRPDFEAYVASLHPGDPDDDALVTRFLPGLHPLDRARVAAQPVAVVAAGVREALARPDGYLRDAAATFRAWEFRLRDVGCPTAIWHGAHDTNHPLRHARWLATQLPDSSLRVLDELAHLGPLMCHWSDILSRLRSP